MAPTPAVDEIGRELAELRAAVAALTEAARRLDARTAELERLLAGAPPDRPAGITVRTVVPAGGRHAAARRRTAPGAPPRPARHRGGRHRSTGPGAGRGASVGRAALSLAVALPWLFCVGCFAVAIGLIAVSTFG